MTLSPTPDYSDYVPDPEDMRNYYVTGRLGWDESHLRTDPKVRKVMDAFDAGIAQVKADAVAEYKTQEVEDIRAKNLQAIEKELNGPTIQESLAEQRATEAALEESWRTNSIPYVEFGERLDEDYQAWRTARGAE